MKLRGKILLAFILAMLPLMAIDGWWFFRNQRREQVQTLRGLRGEAQRAATLVQTFMGLLSGATVEATRQIPQEDRLPAYLRDRLAEFRRWNPGFTGLAWADGDGRIRARAPEGFFERDQTITTLEGFRAVREGQGWVLNSLAMGNVQGQQRPMVSLLVRYPDRTFRGAMLVGLAPEVFRPLFTGEAQRVTIRLADQAGRLVYATDLAELSPDERQAWAAVPGLHDAQGGGQSEPPLRYVDERQPRQWMAVHTAVPQTRWVASALMPTADALRVSGDMLSKDLLEDALILLVCGATATILAHRIASPARRLEAAARRIAAGDRAVQVDSRGEDELAAAGRALEEMARALDGSQRALAEQRDAAQEAARRLGTLSQVSALVSSSLESRRVCDFVVQASTRLLDGAAALLFISAGNGVLGIEASCGIGHPELRTRDRLLRGEGLAGWVFQERQPLVLSNVLADSRTSMRRWFEAEGLRSFAGVPLLLGDQCVGVLCVMRRGERPFQASDVALLAAFGSHVSTAVQNARLFERVEQEGGRLHALLETMPASIVVAEGVPESRDIRVKLTNRAWEALLPQGQAASGRGAADFRLLRLDGRPLPDEELPLHRAIWQGEPTRGMEAALHLPEGTQRYFLVNAAPLPKAGSLPQAVAVFLDITEIKRAELQLERLAADNEALYRQAARDAQVKGLLLEELNHRVRNNLALMISFLELQRETPEGEKAARVLDDAIARVQGLAVIHNVLADPGFQAGGYDDLTHRLAERVLLSGPLAGRVDVRLQAPPLRLPSKHLMALGIILNELFTNIAKYAFPEGRSGIVEVTAGVAGDEVTIRVRDDGVGFSDGITDHSNHMGLNLIRSLAETTLQGAFVLDTQGEATAVLRFPLPDGSGLNS